MPRKYRYLNQRAIQNVADIEGVKAVLFDLLAAVGEYKENTTTDYSVSGNVAREIVVCNNTSAITVTMVAEPRDGDQVLVSRANTGGVTVDFNGKTDIFGNATVTLNQGDSPDYEFDETLDQWRAV